MAIEKTDLWQFLADQGAEVDKLQDNSPLFSSMVLDSMKMVDLVMHVEQACQFRVGAADLTLENFDSVDRIMKFVQRKCGVAG